MLKCYSHHSRYLTTKRTCLASARRILESKTRYQQHISHYHFTWAQTYSIFTATVIVVLYLSYALPEELEAISLLAESGISQLKYVRHLYHGQANRKKHRSYRTPRSRVHRRYSTSPYGESTCSKEVAKLSV